MAASFVEENTTASTAQNDRHFSSRGCRSVEQFKRSTGRFPADFLGRDRLGAGDADDQVLGPAGGTGGHLFPRPRDGHDVRRVPLAVLRHHDLVPHAICVGTFHSYRPVSRAYYYGAPIFRRFFKRLDGHIAVSQAARQYHERYFPADYTVIPNGVDVEHFGCPDVQPIQEFADGRPNILFVGRLEKRKGLTHLIDAFARVQQELADARLIVVGAYDELEKIPFALQARHLGLKVHFVGRVMYQDLPRYYRSADVFCAPSTGMESFGIVLLEAMAAGVPIVASDIDGYRDVLDDGTQGVFVRPEDPAELAAALVSLLRDPSRRVALGALGREKAQRYSWRVVAARVLEYYAAVRQRAFARQPDRARRASIRPLEKMP